MTEVRKYDSPLRTAQSEQTRHSLLVAAMELLASSADELTLRAVARHAGVSVPTVYRYFPSKDDLLDAFGDWANEQVGFVDYPGSLTEALDFPQVLYPGFETHDTLMRAQMAHPTGREIRARALARRRVLIEQAVAGDLPDDVPPETSRAYAALVHHLLSAGAWWNLHDTWGFDGRQTAEATGWALRTLVEALRRDPYSLTISPAQAATQESNGAHA